MNNLKEKLARLSTDKPSEWKAKAQARRENRVWLKKSAAIAVLVLDALKALNLSQKDLAEKLQVSPQHVNKILQGHENLTLETISNLEAALDIQIMQISSGKSKARKTAKKKKPTA